jgi:hypothetical protein
LTVNTDRDILNWMTLYDRQTLKIAAIQVVRHQVRSARHTLESVSLQGRHTPEYEDILIALVARKKSSSDSLSHTRKTVCEREASGCWWTCPRELRQQCALALRVFGVEAGA